MIGKSGKFVTHSPSMGGYAVALPTFKFEDALVYMAMRAREVYSLSFTGISWAEAARHAI